LLQDPPPGMAFEISEAGIAAAAHRGQGGTGVSAAQERHAFGFAAERERRGSGRFSAAVRALAGTQSARKRKDVALILPDFSARISVLDFDSFPSDAREQASLIRFRLKRSVPFDVESAALSYWVQPAADKKVDVVVVMAPLEIVARYEAPFRAAGMNPGLVTTSSIAALELAEESGLSVMTKISGRVLTVLVRGQRRSQADALPGVAGGGTGRRRGGAGAHVCVRGGQPGRAAPDKLMLCGFGARTDEAERRFQEELGVTTEPLRSPLAAPGENNAGLLGYLRSIARNN